MWPIISPMLFNKSTYVGAPMGCTTVMSTFMFPGVQTNELTGGAFLATKGHQSPQLFSKFIKSSREHRRFQIAGGFYGLETKPF
jgi:hypothetical protein